MMKVGAALFFLHCCSSIRASLLEEHPDVQLIRAVQEEQRKTLEKIIDVYFEDFKHLCEFVGFPSSELSKEKFLEHVASTELTGGPAHPLRHAALAAQDRENFEKVIRSGRYTNSLKRYIQLNKEYLEKTCGASL